MVKLTLTVNSKLMRINAKIEDVAPTRLERALLDDIKKLCAIYLDKFGDRVEQAKELTIFPEPKLILPPGTEDKT